MLGTVKPSLMQKNVYDIFALIDGKDAHAIFHVITGLCALCKSKQNVLIEKRCIP